MGNKRIRPLQPMERQYATENYHLISKFLKLSKLDAEEFFDIVVFDFLLSADNWKSVFKKPLEIVSSRK